MREKRWESFAQALSRGEFSSLDDITEWMKAKGLPQNMIDSFVKEFGRQAGPRGDRALKAYEKTINAYSGFLGNILGRLRML